MILGNKSEIFFGDKHGNYAYDKRIYEIDNLDGF